MRQVIKTICIFWVQAVLLNACSDNLSPKPTSIDPKHIIQQADPDRPIEAKIRGHNLVDLQVDLQTGAIQQAANVDVFLNQYQLETVQPVLEKGQIILKVLIPQNLPVGIYDVIVQRASGQRGILPEEFSVDSISDLSLEPSEIRIGAGKSQTFVVKLKDSQKEPTLIKSADSVQFKLIGEGDLGSLSAKELKDGTCEVKYTAPTRPIKATLEAWTQFDDKIWKSSADIQVEAKVDYFQLSLPNEIIAGQEFVVDMVAKDIYGNRVDQLDSTVDLYLANQPDQSIATAIVSDGSSKVNLVIEQAGKALVIRAELQDERGVYQGFSAPFDVKPAGLHHFNLEPLGDQVATVPFLITILAQDKFENLISNVPTPAILHDLTGKLKPDRCSHFIAGRCTLQVSIPQVFQNNIITLSGAYQTTESEPFNVLPNQPSQIKIITPDQNVLPNIVSKAITFELQDGNGNNQVSIQEDLVLRLSSDHQGYFLLHATDQQTQAIDQITMKKGNNGSTVRYVGTEKGDHIITISADDPNSKLIPAQGLIKVSEQGEPSKLVMVSLPEEITAGTGSGPVEVQVQDVMGELVLPEGPVEVLLSTSNNQTCRFAASAEGPFDGRFTQFTIDEHIGIGSFFLQDTKAGNLSTGVSASGLVGHIGHSRVVSADVNTFSIQNIPNQQAGENFTLIIIAEDQFTNRVERFEQTVTISDAANTLQGLQSSNFSQGLLSQNITLEKAMDENKIVVVDQTGHRGESNCFSISPGSLRSVTVSPIASQQTAGVDFSINLIAFDAWNNMVTGFNGTLDMRATTAMQPSQSEPFIDGKLTNQKVKATGASNEVVIEFFYTKNGSSESVGLSTPFAVRHAPLHHFDVAVPFQALVAIPFEVELTAKDQYENLVLDFQDSVSLSDYTGQISPNQSGLFTSGSRNESVIIGKDETDDRIQITYQQKQMGESAAFDVNIPKPAQLVTECWAKPTVLIEGENFTINLSVKNIGDLAVSNVHNDPIDFQAGQGFSCHLLDESGKSRIGPGEQATFIWSCQSGLGSAGNNTMNLAVSGISDLSGEWVYSEPATVKLAITPSDCLINPIRVNPGEDKRVQCNTVVTLGGNPTSQGGVGTPSLVWHPANRLSDDNTSNPTYEATEDAVFKLKAQDELGCTDIRSVRIRVDNAPDVSIVPTPTEDSCAPAEISFSVLNHSEDFTYYWEFGDGTTSFQQTDVRHVYQNSGWYRVELAVSEHCTGRKTREFGISTPSNPVGSIALEVTPKEVAANGSTIVIRPADTLVDCKGNDVKNRGKMLTVHATRGKIISPDMKTQQPGVQVLINDSFVVLVKPDANGGVGRLLLESAQADRAARGSVDYLITGSATAPQIVDFGPTGHSDLPPPFWVVEFSKPMDQQSLIGAIGVVDENGPIQGKVIIVSPYRAKFIPDHELKPADKTYTVSVQARATDIYGYTLDVNYDGQSDATSDRFQWFFGSLQDFQAPQISACESDLTRFSPDHDAQQDSVNISFRAQDDTGLQLAMLAITDDNMTIIHRLIWRLDRNQGQISWNGRNITGSIVNNGVYQYRLKVYDQAYNASQTCDGSFEVQSALDPADFP